MKHLLVLVVFTFLLLLVPAQLLAQGNSGNAPGQNKANGALSQKKDKVVVGSVDQVGGDTISLTEKAANRKSQVDVGSTKIIGKDKKELKVGAVKLKDLIALVSSDSAKASESGKLKVKKIFVQEASESALLRRRAVSGVITNVNGNNLTVSHLVQRERTVTVVVTDLTIITSKSSKTREASGSAEASGSGSLASLTVGTRIAAVGNVSGDSIIAKRIHIIPGNATGVFKRIPVASTSASLVPSSTPSASSSVSASASPSSSPL